MNELFIAK